MNENRRHFLAKAGIASLALLAARGAVAQDAPAACYDPAALPLSQKTRRRSLGYVDASADPKQHCSLCAFFTAGQAGCGTCQILSGGPVSAGGLCSSFAAKAG